MWTDDTHEVKLEQQQAGNVLRDTSAVVLDVTNYLLRSVNTHVMMLVNQQLCQHSHCLWEVINYTLFNKNTTIYKQWHLSSKYPCLKTCLLGDFFTIMKITTRIVHSLYQQQQLHQSSLLCSCHHHKFYALLRQVYFLFTKTNHLFTSSTVSSTMRYTHCFCLTRFFAGERS